MKLPDYILRQQISDQLMQETCLYAAQAGITPENVRVAGRALLHASDPADVWERWDNLAKRLGIQPQYSQIQK
jgi:hypothetical protein